MGNYKIGASRLKYLSCKVNLVFINITKRDRAEISTHLIGTEILHVTGPSVQLVSVKLVQINTQKERMIDRTEMKEKKES